VRPALTRETAAEGARDSRWEKGLDVVETSCGGAVARGFVESEETLPALAGRAGGRVVQQVRFGGEAQEDGHGNTGLGCAVGRLWQGIAMRYFPVLSFSFFFPQTVAFLFKD